MTETGINKCSGKVFGDISKGWRVVTMVGDNIRDEGCYKGWRKCQAIGLGTDMLGERGLARNRRCTKG